eukprot:CFRG1652T1
MADNHKSSAMTPRSRRSSTSTPSQSRRHSETLVDNSVHEVNPFPGIQSCPAPTRLPRVAIIGTGWGLRVQLPHFRKNGFEVVAVWARTELSASTVRADYNIPFVSTDLDEVLMRKEVELVSVATPPFMNTEVCIKTIQTGKHVICEKPMSTDAASARKMLAAAKYYPQLVSIVDHELRFIRVIGAMKNKLSENYCGRLLTIEANVCMASLVGGEYNWWCDQSLGGGALGALGSHMIDVLHYITGEKATAVHGVMRTFVHHTTRINGYRHITADDYCNFHLKFKNDAHGTILLNTHMPGKFVQDITIVGTKGRLLLRGQELWGFQKGMKKEELLLQEKDKSISLFVKGTDGMIRHLRRAFESNQPKPPEAATFEDGLYTQKVMDGVRKSSETGEWVQIEDEEE